MQISFRLVSFAACLLCLVACGEGQNARDILGLGRKAPDEFKVVSRPPLTLPPDFALRPPEDGYDITNLPAADSAARAAVTGEDEEELLGTKRMMGEAETAVGIVRSYELESSADEAFLESIGADEADKSIRSKLEAESVQKAELKKKKQEEFLGWIKPNKDSDEIIVDADAERSRLEANKAAGKKVTEGETPVVEPKAENVFDKIF